MIFRTAYRVFNLQEEFGKLPKSLLIYKKNLNPWSRPTCKKNSWIPNFSLNLREKHSSLYPLSTRRKIKRNEKRNPTSKNDNWGAKIPQTETLRFTENFSSRQIYKLSRESTRTKWQINKTGATKQQQTKEELVIIHLDPLSLTILNPFPWK